MDRTATLDILVVEDDEDARENLRDILELEGHRVATAGSADETLRRGDLADFPAIVLDRRLPDASSDELLPVLRALAPEAAVIVVTGYSDLQGAVAALRQGASDYIVKPIDVDELRARIGRIAERRRADEAKRSAERALRVSEERFRTLVEAAECLIVILRPDGSIAYFSPFAEGLTGYSSAEVCGGDYLRLFLPESSRGPVAEELARARAGRPTAGYENPIVCRDGSQRWITWNTRPLADFEGAPALMKVGQDITHLKRAQERALQSERLAAIGQMIAGLAHESRNALQRSQACLEMLARLARGRPDELNLIDRLQKAQDHLHHLYEDVRSYAAPIRLDRRACDVADVWREAWADLEPARRGRRAVLREEAAVCDARCPADPFRLGQVFRNLFENALAAGPDPVEIAVLAAPAVLDDRPAIRVSVRDNGPGLAPEQRPRIFDPFYTTRTRGTGLGLAIARRIVEAHGGRIAAGEGDGPGAEFVITLPRGES